MLMINTLTFVQYIDIEQRLIALQRFMRIQNNNQTILSNDLKIEVLV